MIENVFLTYELKGRFVILTIRACGNLFGNYVTSAESLFTFDNRRGSY